MIEASLDIVTFKTLVNSAKCFVATDDARPILRFAKFVFYSDKVIVYALDGFKACRIVAKQRNEHITEPISCYIMPINFPINKKYIAEVIFQFNDDKSTTVKVPTNYGYVSYNFRMPTGEFYNVDNVLKSAYEGLAGAPVSFNPALLRGVTNSVTSLGNKTYMTVLVNKDSYRPAVIVSETEGIKAESILLPIRIDQGDISYEYKDVNE